MYCWTLHLSGGTKSCYTAAVAVEHKVYSFECLHDGNIAQIEVYVFNTVSLRWMKFPLVTTGRGERPPEVRSSHSYTAVLIEDIIYIWLVRIYPYWILTFDVDSHRWLKSTISGTVPEARRDHSACVLGKVMYIHGGSKWPSSGRLCHYNDIYKLDTSTMVWSLINTRGTPPPATSHHSATIIGTRMFVCGGFEDHLLHNDIRVFDTENNCWLSRPSAQLPFRGAHGHSAFAYKGELYINWNPNFNMWKFNPETLSWKKVEPKGKGPSQMYHSSCCMVGDRITLFGEYNGFNTPAAGDLYVLDLSPSLKTICKLAVIQYGLEQLELPHNIRWELAAMTNNNN